MGQANSPDPERFAFGACCDHLRNQIGTRISAALFDERQQERIEFDASLQGSFRFPLNAGLEIESHAIRTTMRRIASEMMAPGFARDALCEAILIQAAIDVARFCQVRANHTWEGGLSPRRLHIIDERVALIGPPPSLGELAQASNLSVRQLTRGFRVSRNCSIGAYIAHNRIEGAKSLQSNVASVKEIA